MCCKLIKIKLLCIIVTKQKGNSENARKMSKNNKSSRKSKTTFQRETLKIDLQYTGVAKIIVQSIQNLSTLKDLCIFRAKSDQLKFMRVFFFDEKFL